MSKSDPSDASRINLTDTEEQIHNKIKKAKTDTKSFPANEKDLNKRPEIQNLIGIYSSLKSQKITNTINEFQGKNFSIMIILKSFLLTMVQTMDPPTYW